MKRLIRKALNDYKQSFGYKSEDDSHWSNVYNALTNMPQDFVNELTTAMEKFSTDPAKYTGPNPNDVVASWRTKMGESNWTDEQMETFLNTIEPEVKAINFND